MSYHPSLSIATACAISAALMLSGCNTLQRLSEVGSEPKLAPIQNPIARKDYRPVTMPMPTLNQTPLHANSLWRPGSRAFFKDQRAGQVGDILTVIVNIEGEKAELENATARQRDASESMGAPNLFGLEKSFNKVLPDAVVPSELVNLNSDGDHSSNGSIGREETINIRLAAVVIQTLPNNNLVIAGRQQVRVNAELRELAVTGVIRPEDVRSDNTIAWDKIAEARIVYGGRGVLSDVQKPRYGQEVLDILLPF